MKKWIGVIGLAIFIILCMVGCGKGKEADGIAYIPVWRLFDVNGGTAFDAEGKGYQNYINNMIEDNEEKDPQRYKKLYLAQLYDEILCDYDTIWMNDGIFTQISSKIIDTDNDEEDNVIDIKYTGEYVVGKDGALSLNYNAIGYGEGYPVNFFSMKYYNLNSTADYEYEQNFIDEMISANESSSMINGNFFTYELGIDNVETPHKWASIAGAPIFICSSGKEELKDNYNYSNYPIKNIYLLDNYIVAEQKGFFFEKIESKKDFSIRFEMPENATYYSSDIKESNSGMNIIISDKENVTKWNGVINFYSNYTYLAEYEEGTIEGNWQLFDNHILIIDTSDENNKDNIQAKAYLYLDFENKKIYVPGYKRCDDFLRYINEKKMLTTSDTTN